MWHSNKIFLFNDCVEYQEKTLEIAKRLNLNVNPPHFETYEFSLSFVQGKLQLTWIGKKNIKPIFADFSQNQLKRAASDTLLARAIGIKRNETLHVFDTCGGLGSDAFTLLLLGCRVTVLERSPIIFELLYNAFERISTVFSSDQLSLLQKDAIDYLSEVQEENYPDVIYLDPMYPERNKAASGKKEMQILRALVGEDLDADKLLEKALRCARKRVVVKRRRLDQTLGMLKPDVVFLGKAVRFDVYFTHLIKHIRRF